MLDGIPLKGVRSEHLADNIQLPSGLILPSSVYGAAGSLVAIQPDDVANAGTSPLLARIDHRHPFTSAAPVTIGTANTEGTANTHARSDHGHSDRNTLIGQFVSTANSATFTVSTDTDMVLNNMSVVQNHNYMLIVNTYCIQTAAVGQWALDLRVNGVTVDRFCVMSLEVATARRLSMNGVCFWTAPTTQATDDFLVRATDITATNDITLQATATDRRTFTMIDLG